MPNDDVHHPEATLHSKSNRSSVFRSLSAKARYKEKEPERFSSNFQVRRNNMQILPLHEALKENNVTQLHEVNEMLARLMQLKSNLETG